MSDRRAVAATRPRLDEPHGARTVNISEGRPRLDEILTQRPELFAYLTNLTKESELERDGFMPLCIEIARAGAVRTLPALRRDPFDRLLVAQALSRD